jgi:23S rRNA A2030 N6-methylase RlmJ
LKSFGFTGMPRGRKPSSTPESSDSGKKSRVRFIFEPDRTSPNGITYSWLIHGTYNGKEKAATATRAFWLPFAYEATGEYSEDELKELVQQSIWQMEAQIQHLREKFGLGVGPTSLANEPLVSSASVAAAEDFQSVAPAVAPPQTGTAAPADSDLLDEFADVL